MTRYSSDVFPGSFKKRYATPLRLDEMIRSDSQRRAYLADRAAQRQRLDASILVYDPAQWMASRGYGYDDDTNMPSNLDMDEAAIEVDSCLPYERPVPKRDLAYWLAELENINCEGITMGFEEGPVEEKPTKTVQFEPDVYRLDDPFVSPAKPRAISKGPDQHDLFSPQPDQPRWSREHRCECGLLAQQTSPEKRRTDQLQSSLKRRESVPNFSRPLTPDCLVTPKQVLGSNKKKTVRTRHSDQAIRYERVNGIYLDTTPRSAKERIEGLSIPEVEARDLIRLDEWLQENAPADGIFANIVSHPARPPPPIGGKENSVRAISPQPPSAGKNHTFVSRYSWNVQSIPGKGIDPTRISVATLHESTRTKKDNSDPNEPARELLTEIIRGILGPPGNPYSPENERYSEESDHEQRGHVYRGHPPDYRSVQQPRERRGHFHEHLSPARARYVVDASVPSSEDSIPGSYRKRIGGLGKSAVKLITLRQPGLCGVNTL